MSRTRKLKNDSQLLAEKADKPADAMCQLPPAARELFARELEQSNKPLDGQLRLAIRRLQVTIGLLQIMLSLVEEGDDDVLGLTGFDNLTDLLKGVLKV